MTGQKISRYRIAEKLGEGGMGLVYKAEDINLGRNVALKFLLPHLVADQTTRQRFLREAQAAAVVSHSNICTVYEVEDRGDFIFIAMEFVDGPNVAEKIKPRDGPARPLPLDEALDIAIQTAGGLHAAHEKGVVHRDIKCANILVTQAGQVKISDFGLAYLAERSRLTKSGTTMGTPAYMSPEQALGKLTDRRTDIWSLGVVLYEMVTGRLPFDAEYEQAIIYSIINEDHEPMTGLRAGLPTELDRILAKALAKNPAERYQHADDLMADLLVLRKSVAQPQVSRRSSRQHSMPAAGAERPRHEVNWWAAVGMALAVAAIAVWWLLTRVETGAPPGGSQPVRLAVLPLANLSGGGEDYFSDGMTDALISELGSIGSLRVTSWTSVARYKNAKPSLPHIAAELGVSHVIEGSVVQSADRVRISARLIAADRDEQLWAKSFDRAIEDVLGLQREVAREVAGEIGIQLEPRLQARLQSGPVANREAYMAYLQGVQYWGIPDNVKALERFQTAVELDSGFALARARLALSLAAGGGGGPLSNNRVELGRRAAEEARKALELDENNDVAYGALGWVHTYFEYDWPAAERAFQRSLELNPSAADAYHRYSHFEMMMGRIEEGLQASRRAAELNPFDRVMLAHHVWALYMARRYEEAVEYVESILEADSDNRYARAYAYPAYAQLRRVESILQRKPTGLGLLDDLVQAYVLTGEKARARETLDEALRRNPHANLAYPIALAHVALGDQDGALDWLEKAYESRAFPLPEISIDARFDALRGQERFEKLLARMGLRNAWPAP